MASGGTCLYKAVPNLTTIICYIHVNIFISNYVIFLKNKHGGKALSSSCVYVNCSTVFVPYSQWPALYFSNQLVLWIMESTKVNKLCYCSIRSQQSIPSIHYIKYTWCTSIYTCNSHSTYWKSLHVSLNHHLTPPHSHYIHSMNGNIWTLNVHKHTSSFHLSCISSLYL